MTRAVTIQGLETRKINVLRVQRQSLSKNGRSARKRVSIEKAQSIVKIDISVGFSDVALLIVSWIGFIVLMAVIAYSILITRLESTKEIQEEEEEDLDYEDIG